MNGERKRTGLRVALASYDVRQLRVWYRYLTEQSNQILCSDFSSGEELLEMLRNGEKIDVVVLGSQLEDMDNLAFLERLTHLPHRPLLFLQDGGWGDRAALGSLLAGNLIGRGGQNSLRELMQGLLSAATCTWADPEQMFRRLFTAWGVAQPDSNCDYLLEAAAIAGASADKLAIRKEILQRVAERHNVTIAAVDSGLRRLIDTFETRNTEAWRQFKSESALEDQKITTGKLIYACRAKLLSAADIP